MYLRADLIRCYQNMSASKLHEKVYLITKENMVELAIRYPHLLFHNLWTEIQNNRILVDDEEHSIYPSWFNKYTHLRCHLRMPIELVLPFPIPAVGWDLYYSDTSPGRLSQRYGTGGIINISSIGQIYLFGVMIECGSPFYSEGQTLKAAARLASSMGSRRPIFAFDCLYLIEAMKGRRFVKDHENRQLFRELLQETSCFEEYHFVHIPHEGMTLANAIAKGEKMTMQKLDRQGAALPNFGQPYYCEEMPDDVVKHLNKVENRLHVIRVELLKEPELHLKSEEDISKLQRQV